MRSGRIKFFRLDRGMGFIIDDDDQTADVFLHSTTLAEHGRDGLLVGTRVKFEMSEDAHGHRRAVKVHAIDESLVPSEVLSERGKTLLPPKAVVTSAEPDGMETRMLRVKFFKVGDTSGFGFFGDPGHEDVFVHIRTVRACGFETVAAGDMFEVDIARGPRGRIATAIRRVRV